ncbi:MAG: SAM-dependent methyltransferase [Bryobacteraceae bacterium]
MMARLLAAEIERGGPMRFSRFMETSLYHPEHGYYRRDRFGRRGDFYTAGQLQPVFGLLIAERIRALWREMGSPAEFEVVEPGAGRREMAPFFEGWRYTPVEAGEAFPRRIRGVVFSNEFFDALPVDVYVFREGAWREMRVETKGSRFVWIENGPPGPEAAEYLERNVPGPGEGRIAETPLAALEWMDRIAGALEAGFVLTIDYGYTRAEAVRFPAGTLMSYRRHTAREAVLETPGEQDITAHVPFTALEERGAARGLRTVRFETLARTLMEGGEEGFNTALDAPTAGEQERRRLQLKTLLFGMGETFRVLIQRKDA